MESEFPTTSSALGQLKEGDYDILQLSKKMDEIIKALPTKVNPDDDGSTVATKGKGKKIAANEAPVTIETTTKEGAPDEENLFHLHSLTFQLNITPPSLLVRQYRGQQIVNEDRTRYDLLMTKIKENFDSYEPFDLIDPSFTHLRLPIDVRGLANTKARGFNVSLPSKLQPQNVKPLLRGVDYPYAQFGKEWLVHSEAWDSRNWIHAALALDPNQPQTRKAYYRSEEQRVFLKSGIKAVWEEEGGVNGEDAHATLSLILTIDCWIDLQKIWDPLPGMGSDLMGLIFYSLLPSPCSSVPMVDSEKREDSLRYFYSCLRHAPPVPYSRTVQPSNMPTKLLPFQNRTVAWLLQRERAPVAEGLEGCRDPEGFWASHKIGSLGDTAYRRLTGELVPLKRATVVPDRKGKGRAVEVSENGQGLQQADRKQLSTLLDLSQVEGTMLCEEMGLGKTVEAIALILLNRHPLSTKRDDAKMVQDAVKLEEPPSSPVAAVTAAPVPTRGRGRRGGFGGRPSGSRPKGSKSKPNFKILIIDLAVKLDLSSNPVAMDWWQKEQVAFQTATLYDEVAEINVCQVAATLIVTPPSLLKQWVAEMATHAPSLRVCVYTGWKGLLESVMKRTNKDRKSKEVKDVAKRKRENDRARARNVQKYQRGNVGARVKVEPDYEEDDSEDSDSEELGVDEDSLQHRTQKLFVEYVQAHDVVITTYNDLATDLAVAKHAPERSRRSNVNYRTGDRPRSPLVMAEWWRVIMDEVQLCGDTTSAANMVSLIPRKHSLAVSGTPAKSDVKDLMGSLRFLRVPVLPFDHRLWHRLQQTPLRPAFDGLFQQIAVRTTKKEVSGEFDIPRQTRVIVPIELSEIEMHYYNDTLERQRVILGLPADSSAPRPDGWYLDKILFRASLQNLRQICTHIQVGHMGGGHAGRPKRGGDRLRLGLGNELLGLNEVLKRMKEDNNAEIMVGSRAQLRAMILKAQLLLFDETSGNRHQAALALYTRVEHKAQTLLEASRVELAEHLQGREDSYDDDEAEDDQTSTAEAAISQQERDQRLERNRLRTSIREILLILHQAYFFQGDWYHVQKDAALEVEYYNKAEALRKEIFARPLQVANNSILKLEKTLTGSTPIRSVRDLQTKETDRMGGISTQEAMDQTNELLKIMNENALLVYSWREKIIELLKSPIDAEKDLPAGDEEQDVVDPEKEYYAQALQAQGQVEAHMFAYAAAIADRREMMLEERSLLATHDARVTKHRTTKAAVRALADSEIPANVPDDVAEQAAGLMAERQALKDAREIRDCQKPLKAYVISLNNIVHGNYREEEIAIAQNAIADFKAYIAEQTEYIDKLNKELEVFRATFNRRVSYFAAYQIVSDSVTAPIYKNLHAEIDEADQEILTLETRLGRCQVKSRYLQHLGDKEHTDEELRDDCIICFGSSDDTKGILLACGHFFCLSCFTAYRNSTQGAKCPSCRAEIDPREGTNFRLGPDKEKEVLPKRKRKSKSYDNAEGEKDAEVDQDLADVESQIIAEEAIEIPEVPPAMIEAQKRRADLERLNTIDEQTRLEIASMDVMGEFGSKINFLIKHLLYYRIKDRSARHVVFSNWSDSLFIVIQALKANDISFVALDKGGKQAGDMVEQFHKDESITVFLLHAERESAGLTLTSCRVVHLLEPVLKHSFELQAIGRVDRLGQKEETTVYCYSTQDTVESRILSQGVRNGTSIYLKEEEQGDQVVEDMENVASAAHKGGDIGGDGNEEEMLQLIML